MAQFVTRLDDSLSDRVDSLVSAGVFESRSEAVRVGLERLVDALEREQVGHAIAVGYQRIPPTDDELALADAATETMIREEH